MRTILEENIENKISIDFSGKIILSRQRGKELGEISFKKGKIHYARLGKKQGIKAILHAFIHEKEISLSQVKTPNNNSNISSPYFKILEAVKRAKQNHTHYEKFTLPKNISLFVNPEFIKDGPPLEKDEYKVLLKLLKFNISDIGAELDLLDHEITKQLITLRKKKAFYTEEVIK